MSKELWSTFDKFTALRDGAGLTAAQFVDLCAVHGIETTAMTISRSIKNGKFTNHEMDQQFRPLILKLEDLVERAGAFPISFDDVFHIKVLLDLLEVGEDIRISKK